LGAARSNTVRLRPNLQMALRAKCNCDRNSGPSCLSKACSRALSKPMSLQSTLSKTFSHCESSELAKLLAARCTALANVSHNIVGLASNLQSTLSKTFSHCESGELAKLLAARCTALADVSHNVVGLGSNLCRQQWQHWSLQEWFVQKIKC